MGRYVRKHICTIVPMPADLLASLEWSGKDRTVNNAMGEDGLFERKGYMQHWDTSEECKRIVVKTLVINGVGEQASGPAVQPFLDNIPDVRFRTFERGTHCPHLEERGEYMEVVGEFLLG
jgi:L-proline amide hydrolase